MSFLSPSSVPQNGAHVLLSVLSSLLKREKEPTRGWLRDEIDQLVDPMLNSLFQRLINKLVGNQESAECGSVSADYGGYINSTRRIESSITQIYQPSTFNCQSRSHTTPQLPTEQGLDNFEPESIKQKFNEKNRDNHENTDHEEGDDDDYLEKDTSKVVKRPRQSSPTISSSSIKHIITLKRQCRKCGQMFAKTEFTAHMWQRHSIRKICCLVKGCKQSFDSKVFLGQHIAQCHQSTTNSTHWHCDQCDSHFTSYHHLSGHNNDCHLLGHFQCSFPSCTFTGENKSKVANHYRKHRTPKKSLKMKCPQSGCVYETHDSSNLKRHKRVHLNIKPFRCNWSQCGYSSTTQANTLRHIRSIHLMQNNNTKMGNSATTQSQLTDPNDYLVVVW